MGKTKYYYNPETCQYERVRVTFWSALWYSAGVIAVGSLVFAGLVLTADQLVVTDQERSLQAENEAMEKYKVVLASNLNSIETTIADLHGLDSAIHRKLFESGNDKSLRKSQPRYDASMLSASSDEFNNIIKQLNDETHKLNQQSTRVNHAFGDRFNMTHQDATELQSIPTFQPLNQIDPELVVSGFGVRINPFHKGKYMHPGIDFAAPRGTAVQATANGTVTLVNRSDLQAGYGNYIEVDHGNGFVTRYAHLEDITVKRGQRVTKGAVIGAIGSSGGSIAPHLHYEVLHHGEHVDPLYYMVEGLTSQQYNRLV